MKVVGIIAEYNPFHKGHEYHIRYAREILDYVAEKSEIRGQEMELK